MNAATAGPTIRARTSELLLGRLRVEGLSQDDYAAAHDQATAEVLAGWATWEEGPIALKFDERAVVETVTGRTCLLQARVDMVSYGQILEAEDGTRVLLENVVRWMRVPRP